MNDTWELVSDLRHSVNAALKAHVAAKQSVELHAKEIEERRALLLVALENHFIEIDRKP